MAKRGVIADSMDDVMVAGRSFGAFMVFFVTVGETYGIGTMIGVPGAIYSKGVSYSLWFLGYILLGFVVGYFMNPAIWRMGKISGAMTMPDCFRWRYGSKALEVLVAVICIVFLLPWMQMQFAGLATILRYIGWDISYTVGIGISAAIAYLYIAVAGIRAPAWISIMKDILMMAAIVSGGLVAIHNMPGGISGIFDMAIAHFPDKVVIDAEPITKNATFVFSTIIFQALGFCVTPLQYQFIFTAKSEDTIRRNQIITKNSVADAYGLEAEQLKDDDYRHVIASMLRVADFGIQSLQMRDTEPAPSQRNDIFTNIEAIHTVQDTEGNTSSYALNMAEESDGTNSYFKLIGVVKKVLDEGTLLVADEMDAHLHPLLTKHLVSLFNSVEFNPNGAQLIFTSHNTNLLDLDVLRRDQIWFTEKDEQTAATDLFSLYDFSIRKDAKVEKGYLIGRYGAIPFIKGGL